MIRLVQIACLNAAVKRRRPGFSSVSLSDAFRLRRHGFLASRRPEPQ
jgi:hypothetical protein